MGVPTSPAGGYHRAVTTDRGAGSPTPDTTSPVASQLSADPGRVLRLTMGIAIDMLGSGAQTDDVEAAIVRVARALGVKGAQAAVTFSTIAISYDAADDEPPTTLMHIVHTREVDFDRLASVAAVATRIHEGGLDLPGAEAELAGIEAGVPPYGRIVMFFAPAVSAAGSTMLFGGGVLEAVVTLGIALLVQPALVAIDRSKLPPFFRVVFGSAASTLLVTLVVALNVPVSGGLVLTGSLLRFLPGYALVSGFRDLIGESIISGTARLAEALLLGAGIALGTAIGLRVGASYGVELSIVTVGQEAWTHVVLALAAAAAVGAYAIRLGVTGSAVIEAAMLGAGGWLLFQAAASPAAAIGPSIATLLAAIGIGVVARILARIHGAPAALWVVPAILPLLPGLQLVRALLADTDPARIAGLIDATATAFLLGTGVATGDIIVTTVRRIREHIVVPAIDALAGGVNVLVVSPVGRAVTAALERSDDDADDPEAAEEPTPERTTPADTAP